MTDKTNLGYFMDVENPEQKIGETENLFSKVFCGEEEARQRVEDLERHELEDLCLTLFMQTRNYALSISHVYSYLKTGLGQYFGESREGLGFPDLREGDHDDMMVAAVLVSEMLDPELCATTAMNERTDEVQEWEEKLIRVVDERSEGMVSQGRLARLFGRSPATINRVVNEE